jgi:hypothetical protein
MWQRSPLGWPNRHSLAACRTPHSTDESIWITGPILDRRFRRIWNIVVQSFARERQTNGVKRFEGHPVSMTNTHAAYGIIEDANGVTDAVLAASAIRVDCELGLLVDKLKLLSRDSRLGQRNDHTLAAKVDCVVNGPIEFADFNEGLMCLLIRPQVVPDDLDVVQFGCIFSQPFDGGPVCPSGKGRSSARWVSSAPTRNASGYLGNA